jgi:hypothetical protein
MSMAGNPKWQKGQSGNPGGRRKKDYRIRDLAQQYTVEAIATLRSIMKSSGDDRARVAAATHLLDRAFGKPAQSVDLTNSDGTLANAWANARAEMEKDDDAGEAGVTH